MTIRGFFPGLKRITHEADCPFPSTAEVTNVLFPYIINFDKYVCV